MILIKEEFVGGEKWRRAVKLGGSDVIALWLAMKCYCSSHPDTEGFVPNEELDGLPGAPRGARRKALQALIECGRLLPCGGRGAGLVEVAQGGWQMHDYLDHSAAPEEIELRRQKARLRKQSYRESKRRELDAVRRLAGELAEGTPGDMSHGTSGDIPGDTSGDGSETVPRDDLAGASPSASASVPAPARAGAHSSPTHSSPTHKKSLTRPSTIRGARARPHPVEACAEHRLFAAENGLELEPVLAELRASPSTAGLSADEIRTRLASLLMTAAEQRQAIGGAA
jgi:hypothetical protein